MKAIIAIPILAALLSGLSGCALSPEQQQAKFKSASNDDLCIAAVTPKYSLYASRELADRGYSCDWTKTHAMIEQKRLDAEAAQAAAAAALQATSDYNRRKAEISQQHYDEQMRQQQIYQQQRQQNRPIVCTTYGNITTCNPQ